jgi:hypothetical protein
MPSISRATKIIAALASTALVLTLGSIPFFASGADHLDAPSLGHISVDAQDNLSVGKVNGPLDINDVYLFKAGSGRTALAMTVNPAINLLGPTTFASNGAYTLNVDLSGDAVADLRYVATFGDPDANGVQHYVVKANGTAIASGFTDNAKGMPITRNGVKAFAGQRSDPFFFDLLGFLGTVKHQGTRRLNDAHASDFFSGLNTLAIVLEVPNSALGGDGNAIGVWGTTCWQDAQGNWHQADQMGRPAINTVFNAAVADKEAFNQTAPSQQRTALNGTFRNNIIGVLEFFSSLDSEGAYTAAQAAGLADVLLPDMLTYTVGTTAAGPLNGRGLTDDVIDVELNIVTGGYPFPGRDGNGAIPGDSVSAHTDYLRTFPYLGTPHP